MITLVSWLWKQQGYPIRYTAKHVNIWANMVERHITIPHRLLCITDDPTGIDIPTLPLWNFEEIESPKWPGRCRPQAYRCLRMFDKEVGLTIGARFCSMDLDCVITGSLDSILNRTEDFLILWSPQERNCYNSSLIIMDAGARQRVWDRFTPYSAITASDLYLGSDQAFIRYVLGPNETTLWNRDGIYQFYHSPGIRQSKAIPIDCRIVFFAGNRTPWDPSIKVTQPWVLKHYR